MVVKALAHSQDTLGETAHESWKSPGTARLRFLWAASFKAWLFSWQRSQNLPCFNLFFLDFLSYTTLKIISCRNCPCLLPALHVVCSEQSQLSHFLLTGQMNLILTISVALHWTCFCLFLSFSVLREKMVCFQ